MQRNGATFRKHSAAGVDWAAWAMGLGLGFTLALQATTMRLPISLGKKSYLNILPGALIAMMVVRGALALYLLMKSLCRCTVEDIYLNIAEINNLDNLV
jgi:hypothetical protein